MSLIRKVLFSVLFANLFVFSAQVQSFEANDNFSLRLEETQTDYYWGQDFVKAAGGYAYSIGKYAVDISQKTYNKFSKISSNFSSSDFTNFGLALYDAVADQAADAAIDAALGTLVSGLAGLDPTGISAGVLDEIAKTFAGELADELGLKELPLAVSQKAIKFVKSYKK